MPRGIAQTLEGLRRCRGKATSAGLLLESSGRFGTSVSS